MSESVWYYARGEQEKGPITTVQIKALAAAGKLQRDDLVWKEGMENWVPASEVPGLFAVKPAAANAANSDSPAQPDQPRPTPRRQPSSPSEVNLQTRTISRAVFVCGLLLALLARGCDTLGDRNVARRKAIAESERREFQDNWDRKQRDLRADRQRLQDNPNRSNVDNQRLQEVNAAISKLDTDRREQERLLENGEWLDNDQAATKAATDDRIWGYWRHATLLFGTILLTLSLLGVAYSSVGPERWISFIILVVLVYSLYAANSVWSRMFS